MIQISPGELSQTELYKKSITESQIPEYVIKYISVVIDFILFYQKNKYIYKEGYLNYILHQGLQSMKHIYMNLLLYTKNVDLVFFHLQKGYYYYIEFLQQIKKEENSFIHFNINDAIIFIYKKTIYEIDEKHVMNHKSDNENKKIIYKIEDNIREWNNFIYNIILELKIDSDGCIENPNKIDKNNPCYIEKNINDTNINENITSIFKQLHKTIITIGQNQFVTTISTIDSIKIKNYIKENKNKKNILEIVEDIQQNTKLYINE